MFPKQTVMPEYKCLLKAEDEAALRMAQYADNGPNIRIKAMKAGSKSKHRRNKP